MAVTGVVTIQATKKRFKMLDVLRSGEALVNDVLMDFKKVTDKLQLAVEKLTNEYNDKNEQVAVLTTDMRNLVAVKAKAEQLIFNLSKLVA
jgi:hypothetical protein